MQGRSYEYKAFRKDNQGKLAKLWLKPRLIHGYI